MARWSNTSPNILTRKLAARLALLLGDLFDQGIVRSGEPLVECVRRIGLMGPHRIPQPSYHVPISSSDGGSPRDSASKSADFTRPGTSSFFASSGFNFAAS